MAVLRVTTSNGSVYTLDTLGMRWKQVESTQLSGILRTPDGDYEDVVLVVGKPMVLIGPPLDPTKDKRMIETSPVVKVEGLSEVPQ